MMSNPNEPKSFQDPPRSLKSQSEESDGVIVPQDPTQVRHHPHHPKRQFSEDFYQTMSEAEVLESLEKTLNETLKESLFSQLAREKSLSLPQDPSERPGAYDVFMLTFKGAKERIETALELVPKRSLFSDLSDEVKSKSLDRFKSLIPEKLDRLTRYFHSLLRSQFNLSVKALVIEPFLLKAKSDNPHPLNPEIQKELSQKCEAFAALYTSETSLVTAGISSMLLSYQDSESKLNPRVFLKDSEAEVLHIDEIVDSDPVRPIKLGEGNDFLIVSDMVPEQHYHPDKQVNVIHFLDKVPDKERVDLSTKKGALDAELLGLEFIRYVYERSLTSWLDRESVMRELEGTLRSMKTVLDTISRINKDHKARFIQAQRQMIQVHVMSVLRYQQRLQGRFEHLSHYAKTHRLHDDAGTIRSKASYRVLVTILDCLSFHRPLCESYLKYQKQYMGAVSTKSSHDRVREGVSRAALELDHCVAMMRFLKHLSQSVAEASALTEAFFSELNRSEGFLLTPFMSQLERLIQDHFSETDILSKHGQKALSKLLLQQRWIGTVSPPKQPDFSQWLAAFAKHNQAYQGIQKAYVSTQIDHRSPEKADQSPKASKKAYHLKQKPQTKVSSVATDLSKDQDHRLRKKGPLA